MSQPLPEVDSSLEGTGTVTGTAIDSPSANVLQLPVASFDDFNAAFSGSFNFSGAMGGQPSATGDRAAVIEYAKSMLGTPYVWGGTTPGKGLDCSGFTQAVWKKFGVKLPRVSFQQANAGQHSDIASLSPGDLVLSRSGDHVAIYMGNGEIIEAPHAGASVRIRKLGKNEGYYGVKLNYANGGGNTPTGSGRATGNFQNLFNAAGQKYGIDPRLLSAVAKAESGYNINARSAAGAQGLMQFMPGTARSMGVKNPFDPAQSIDGAARYLKSLYQQTGSWELAIAAYNAGPGAVKKYKGIPPYAETQAYVRRVTGYWKAM